jgi:hypothetical protein
VATGGRARVTLNLTADRLIETRRWSAWKPWTMAAAGSAVAAAGLVFERQARVDRTAAANAIVDSCASLRQCEPVQMPRHYDRAQRETQLAVGAIAVGGTAAVAGFVLAWFNLPRAQRPETAVSPVEIIPSVSSARADLTVVVRF